MPPEARRLKILVADPTAVGRQLAEFLISKRGHTVHAVAAAAELFARLDAATDAVLVQFPLSDADAATVAREVRRQAPQAVLFAIAGAPLNGFDETLAAPLDPDQLDHALDKIARPIVDVPRLMTLMDGNRELLRKVVSVLEPTVENSLANLKAALAAADAESLTVQAHRLKGALGNVAADDAVAASKALEHMGKAGDLSAAPAALATLEAMVKRVLAELRRIAAG